MTRVRKRVKKASTNYSSMEHPPITPSSYGTSRNHMEQGKIDQTLTILMPWQKKHKIGTPLVNWSPSMFIDKFGKILEKLPIQGQTPSYINYLRSKWKMANDRKKAKALDW